MIKKWLNPLIKPLDDTPGKKTYRRYREAGTALHHKIIDSV